MILNNFLHISFSYIIYSSSYESSLHIMNHIMNWRTYCCGQNKTPKSLFLSKEILKATTQTTNISRFSSRKSKKLAFSFDFNNILVLLSQDVPTPRLIQRSFERMSPPTSRGKTGAASRDIYVNSQWALGGEGTGAPVSYMRLTISVCLSVYLSVCLSVCLCVCLSQKSIRRYCEDVLRFEIPLLCPDSIPALRPPSFSSDTLSQT